MTETITITIADHGWLVEATGNAPKDYGEYKLDAWKEVFHAHEANILLDRIVRHLRISEGLETFITTRGKGK